ARITPTSKVLEIGTGSGYQTAVLAELAGEVYSIEIVPDLAERAKQTLQSAGYNKIHLRQGDGWQGWNEAAPFDAILVTAAAPAVPELLIPQLRLGGLLIVPIEGEKNQLTTLEVIERTQEHYRRSLLGTVKFVPLTGEARK